MEYRFALIGYPIKHSLSPWIHQQFLKKAELDGEYFINEITPDDSFEEQINKLKKMNINGFNVTVPYKQKIISFLDEIDQTANVMGAVNTVANQNGKWIGYNTDGIGFLHSLKNRFPELHEDKSSRILIVGSGGAARGIFYALDAAGFKFIDIANRTIEKANVIKKLGSSTGNVLSLSEAEQHIGNYDVIIQTTNVGMKPLVDNTIINVNKVPPETVVSDIVYQPIKTKFLQQAEEAGAAIHFGHSMLLYQAQYSFEIWTNIKVAMNGLDRELQLILEGR
ncbi:shikimate dehydrogenase [Virgibacillus indicus]|uniref:Shikimate dehydrogenase (NADP(+)) n=1 Tax=Virgibacillus indicus TaxID=2024554 RepID=A0A265NEM6_9BACI|nr:shikimate dehydrogenase [Virgibacillus indicus]OZU89904.1 shikimate dehydrogenase [Virgibacillus indicus]